MRPEVEKTRQDWPAEVTAEIPARPEAMSRGEGEQLQVTLPRALQEIADEGLSTRRMARLIVLFAILVALEVVLLVHVPDVTRLRVYPSQEKTYLVKP